MTPQELLELAAYAIGLRGKQLSDGTIAYSEFGRFNSLTNKADAFDLMVKLVAIEGEAILVFLEGNVQFGNTEEERSCVPQNGNIEAATMLAITRAAAAIGKQMKARNENADN